MNGVHDMGGMQGLGAIVPEPEGSPFHAAWEARVHAMTVASPTRGNIDAGRHQREMIPGPEYLAMSYYQKWFRSLCDLLVAKGFATRQEITTGKAAAGAVKAVPHLTGDAVTETLTRPGTYIRESVGKPAFARGDRVRARNINPDGHTRLPRYARGHSGVVVAIHGTHVFPDSHAHGQGEDPRTLYGVRFTARELWGEAANPRDTVTLDLWEPYLERA